MNAQTQTQTPDCKVTTVRNSSAETVIGFAVMGLLVVGAVGIDKATEMDRGIDVLLCLLGSVAAFVTVYFIYFRKR